MNALLYIVAAALVLSTKAAPTAVENRGEVNVDLPYSNGEGGRYWVRGVEGEVNADLPFSNGDGGRWWVRNVEGEVNVDLSYYNGEGGRYWVRD